MTNLKPFELQHICGNPDGCSEQDIRLAAVAIGRSPVNVARILFTERPKGYVTATRDLGHYCWNKTTAMACRRRGDIQSAIVYENICETIYNRLPGWAKW